jgi:hypothetical protein
VPFYIQARAIKWRAERLAVADGIANAQSAKAVDDRKAGLGVDVQLLRLNRQMIDEANFRAPSGTSLLYSGKNTGIVPATGTPGLGQCILRIEYTSTVAFHTYAPIRLSLLSKHGTVCLLVRCTIQLSRRTQHLLIRVDRTKKPDRVDV